MKERKTVRVLCINSDDQILLIKMLPIHIQLPYCWTLPGGGVDEGESNLEAVKRELFEETGIEAIAIEPTSIKYVERIVTARGKTALFKENFYIARCTNITPSRTYLQPDEQELFLEYKWWSAQEIKDSQEPILPEDLGNLALTHLPCKALSYP